MIYVYLPVSAPIVFVFGCGVEFVKRAETPRGKGRIPGDAAPALATHSSPQIINNTLFPNRSLY